MGVCCTLHTHTQARLCVEARCWRGRATTAPSWAWRAAPSAGPCSPPSSTGGPTRCRRCAALPQASAAPAACRVPAAAHQPIPSQHRAACSHRRRCRCIGCACASPPPSCAPTRPTAPQENVPPEVSARVTTEMLAAFERSLGLARGALPPVVYSRTQVGGPGQWLDVSGRARWLKGSMPAQGCRDNGRAGVVHRTVRIKSCLSPSPLAAVGRRPAHQLAPCGLHLRPCGAGRGLRGLGARGGEHAGKAGCSWRAEGWWALGWPHKRQQRLACRLAVRSAPASSASSPNSRAPATAGRRAERRGHGGAHRRQPGAAPHQPGRPGPGADHAAQGGGRRGDWAVPGRAAASPAPSTGSGTTATSAGPAAAAAAAVAAARAAGQRQAAAAAAAAEGCCASAAGAPGAAIGRPALLYVCSASGFMNVKTLENSSSI